MEYGTPFASPLASPTVVEIVARAKKIETSAVHVSR